MGTNILRSHMIFSSGAPGRVIRVDIDFIMNLLKNFGNNNQPNVPLFSPLTPLMILDKGSCLQVEMVLAFCQGKAENENPD